MLFPAIAALLVMTIVGSSLILIHALRAAKEQRDHARREAVFTLAHERDGLLTAAAVAARLQVNRLQADRLLRGLVDELNVSLVIDDRAGCVQFWFTELRGQPPTAPRPVGRSNPQRPARRRTTAKNPAIGPDLG